MSSKRRAIEKQKKANSPKAKEKRAKKQFYGSYEAKLQWEDKKGRREQRQEAKRATNGIPRECQLPAWEKPNAEKCKGCRLKCSSKR